MITLSVNGRAYNLHVDADTPLLWVLREHLGLTGTKFGCGIAQCGACTVHVDGKPVRSCVTPIAGIAGSKVLTIEGLASGGLHLVQQAWQQLNVPQCGYCQSGQIMSAVALLQTTAFPTDSDIDAAMKGNLCRCGAYSNIRAAIHLAAKTQQQGDV